MSQKKEKYTHSPVPHSVGTNKPVCMLPPLACDSHMHIFDNRFAPSPHWARTPPHAPVTAYRMLQKRLGTSRAVVVTPSTYGTDNSCTLDALDQLGECARGVAVVDLDVTNDELARLSARRVRGLRVNFVSPQSWGTTTPEMLVKIAQKVANHPDCVAWHIQIFVEPEMLILMQKVLQQMPVPLVIDHLGRIDPSDGASSEAYAVLRRLLDAGNTWVKLSGAYMRSTVGAPSYSDTLPLGCSLVNAAPERLVWGSDWPHTTEVPGSVNDADLVNLLYFWAGSESKMNRILVDNPSELYNFN